MTRVALDLEEVLADTINEACASTDNLCSSDFETWDLSNYTWQVYSGVSDNLWRRDTLSIDPVEPNLSRHVADIRENCEHLDIVTARLHVDEQVRAWLSHHSIPYDGVVSTDQPKSELDYDVYIDDNPEMHGTCRLLLRDHPHNRNIDAQSSDQTDRIKSLSEAPAYL